MKSAKIIITTLSIIIGSLFFSRQSLAAGCSMVSTNWNVTSSTVGSPVGLVAGVSGSDSDCKGQQVQFDIFQFLPNQIQLSTANAVLDLRGTSGNLTALARWTIDGSKGGNTFYFVAKCTNIDCGTRTSTNLVVPQSPLPNTSGIKIDNFDLNPRTIANTSASTQLRMTLKVTMNVAQFNSSCGSNTNSFSWDVYWDVTGIDLKRASGDQTINRISPTLTFDLSQPISIDTTDPNNIGTQQYYAQINCPGFTGKLLARSSGVPITFGSMTNKSYACVSPNNKYACSQANLTNCSDVPTSSGCPTASRPCIVIGANLCGQSAGGGGGGGTGGGGTGGGGTGCGTPGQPDCQPGKTVTYGFEIPNPLKGGVKDLAGLVQILAQWIFNLAIPIAVAMIVYSGIEFLRSGGDPGKVTKAKQILTYAVIGLAIILIGNGFVTLIKSILELGGTGGPAPNGNTICINNVCNNGTPGTCQSDPDCTIYGPQAPGAIGNKCSKDRNCVSGLNCKNAICQRPTGNLKGEPCVGGVSCDVGLACDLTSEGQQIIDGQTLGTCFETSATGGKIGDTCQNDKDCISGLKCNQICQRNGGNLDGETCLKTSNPSNCQSRACNTTGNAINGTCVPYSGT